MALRISAARPAQSPVRTGVLARAEQGLGPEQAAALPVQEAVDQPEAVLEGVEAALEEVDLRLAGSANHVGLTVARIVRVNHLRCETREPRRSAVKLQHG